MTRAEYVAAHGREPHDEGYWGPGGVQVAARQRDGREGMRPTSEYHMQCPCGAAATDRRATDQDERTPHGSAFGFLDIAYSRSTTSSQMTRFAVR